jgi:hypothetical protein
MGFGMARSKEKGGGISLVGETKTSSPSLAGFPLSKCFSFLFLISKTRNYKRSFGFCSME